MRRPVRAPQRRSRRRRPATRCLRCGSVRWLRVYEVDRVAFGGDRDVVVVDQRAASAVCDEPLAAQRRVEHDGVARGDRDPAELHDQKARQHEDEDVGGDVDPSQRHERERRQNDQAPQSSAASPSCARASPRTPCARPTSRFYTKPVHRRGESPTRAATATLDVASHLHRIAARPRAPPARRGVRCAAQRNGQNGRSQVPGRGRLGTTRCPKQRAESAIIRCIEASKVPLCSYFLLMGAAGFEPATSRV